MAVQAQDSKKQKALEEQNRLLKELIKKGPLDGKSLTKEVKQKKAETKKRESPDPEPKHSPSTPQAYSPGPEENLRAGAAFDEQAVFNKPTTKGAKKADDPQENLRRQLATAVEGALRTTPDIEREYDEQDAHNSTVKEAQAEATPSEVMLDQLGGMNLKGTGPVSLLGGGKSVDSGVEPPKQLHDGLLTSHEPTTKASADEVIRQSIVQNALKDAGVDPGSPKGKELVEDTLRARHLRLLEKAEAAADKAAESEGTGTTVGRAFLDMLGGGLIPFGTLAFGKKTNTRKQLGLSQNYTRLAEVVSRFGGKGGTGMTAGELAGASVLNEVLFDPTNFGAKPEDIYGTDADSDAQSLIDQEITRASNMIRSLSSTDVQTRAVAEGQVFTEANRLVEEAGTVSGALERVAQMERVAQQGYEAYRRWRRGANKNADVLGTSALSKTEAEAIAGSRRAEEQLTTYATKLRHTINQYLNTQGGVPQRTK